ncbi:MFS monocarboxylate [Phlyctema vagabunda]|uniref:MFS monocarboxylate n=1 Tax=Phlyctema vagabunda TaxID=108571 RepID=A0ABR4PNS3_9HELO
MSDQTVNGTEAMATSRKSEFTQKANFALLGAFLVMFCSVGYINAFGVFQEYYLETMLSDHSASSISWLGTFNIFCLFGGTLISGFLNDKYGPRSLLWAGSAIIIFALFMNSLSTKYYQLFLSQALLLGIGISLIILPALTTVSQYFAAHRGLCLGLIVSGSSLGGVIWPIALHRLLSEIGFGWTLRTIAFIMLPLLTIGCLTIIPPPEQKTRQNVDFSCLKNPVLVLLALGLFFVYLGLFTLFFYVTPWTVSLGLDGNMAFYMVSIVNAASLFGRILPGILADRIGPYNVMVLAVVLSGIVCMCWTTAKSLGGIIVLSLAYGFTSGAVIALQSACAAAVVKPQHYGIAMGAVMSFLSIAGLVGTPINGQILDAFGFLGVSLFSGLALLVGGIIIMLGRCRFESRLWAKA